MAIDPTLIPDTIHWYEGMLLLPEHFRAAGRRPDPAEIVACRMK